MNTTAVHINTQLYNSAAEYARRQHTSVDKVLEGLIMALPKEDMTKEKPKLKRPTHFSPALIQLVGAAKTANSNPNDINGDEARWEYLKEKYNL